jgi:hypothetical protein
LGHDNLPFIYIDGELEFYGRYPDPVELLTVLGLDGGPTTQGSNRPQGDAAGLLMASVPGADEKAGGCCPGGGGVLLMRALLDNVTRFLFFTGKGILDTAPTGHTLLLLDATEAYHRQIARNGEASMKWSKPCCRGCGTRTLPRCCW